jgi:Fe-S cluster assembly protein SufD
MKTVLLEKNVNKKIKVTENTQYVLVLSENVKPEETSIELVFEKEGVAADLYVLFKLDEGRTLDLETVSNHKSPHTTCYTEVRGVLGDKAKTSYVGKIIISKKAQQTKSYLQDDVLVLGEDTKNESQPILEIEANDVKASHGATTGRVDEEKVYYLTSRGLSPDEAKDMVVEGFFEALLAKIKDEKVREKVASAVKS